MGTVTLASRCLVAVVFAVAAATKLSDPASTSKAFREFGAGESLARLAVLLAPAELLIAAGLVIEPTARWAALAAIALLLVFIAGMLNALRMQLRPECGCFGALRPAPIGRSTVLRNALLLLLATLVVAFGSGPSLSDWLAGHGIGVIALVAALVFVIATALMFGITSPRSVPDGAAPSSADASLLHIGDQAPDFHATDVAGGPHSMHSLRAAGRPVVFIFVDVDCGTCLDLFQTFALWQSSLAERLSIVLVGGGDPARMRQQCEQLAISDALLDTDRAVSIAFGSYATPSAIVVSPDGVIASGLAVGEDAIEDLIRLTLSRERPIPVPWTRTVPAA